MANPCKEKVVWPTREGTITIGPYLDPEALAPLSMEGSFSEFANYRPIVSSKESLARAVAEPGANVTLAVFKDRLIVGFAVLRYPGPSERWLRVGDGIMMEVSVIEVSRPWRSMGISRQLLGCLINHPAQAAHIYYMVGYSWTWDLGGADLSPIGYRNMMIRLFSGQGFKTFQTNEPNIMMRPENLFMARIGADISDELQTRFKLVRFNMDR